MSVEANGPPSRPDNASVLNITVTSLELSRIQRRIDLRIMPLICLSFLVLRIDYSNVTYAAVMNVEQGHNIKQQLNISPNQWSWVIASFYYPYTCLDPVMPIIMKRINPSKYFGSVTLIWGAIVCAIGSANNYRQLLVLRILQGTVEAGWFPCAVFYLAFWFRPEELTRRIALMYSAIQVSLVLNGFLAYGISFADGRLAGWRWLYIIEGLPAILLGITTFFVIPDYPQTARFLSEREKSVILQCVMENAPSKHSKTWEKAQFIQLLKDPTLWTFACIWFFQSVGGFGLSFVLPTVIFQLGITTSALSNVLAVPGSFCALIALNILGYLVQTQGWNPFRTAMAVVLGNITSYIILLTVHSPLVRYLSLVAATATANSVHVVLWSSRVKTARGTTGKALAIGWTASFNSLSGVFGPMIYSASYGPRYTVSFLVSLVLLSCAVISIVITGLLVGESQTEESPSDREPIPVSDNLAHA